MEIQVYRIVFPDRVCPSGEKVVAHLTATKRAFVDIPLRSPEAVAAFKAQWQVETTPQVFVDGERIGGWEALLAHPQLGQTKPETSYAPVAAVFGTAALVAWAARLGMPGFMGMALAMLASLKFADLEAFAAQFAQYDAIAQRFRPYGKAYPVLELGLGLGFLAGWWPLAIGLGSLVLGAIGAYSVIDAVYVRRKSLTCACVGGNSRAPLGLVTLAENAAMILMGLAMTVGAPEILAPPSHRSAEFNGANSTPVPALTKPAIR
ncbi:MAG: MauE/DoxX family redox-associated membrane protein [Pseudanabaenaceae cyanobacterium]